MKTSSTHLSLGKLRQFGPFTSELALEAGRILSRGFSGSREASKKGRIDLVTKTDVACERYLVRRIRQCFPEHDILAEENTRLERGRDFRWVIDPLDGATNFAHGYPVFCVSLALEYQGEVVVGVVYDPNRDEMFRALRGRGSFVGRRRLQVSACAKLENALCATGFPYDMHTSRQDNLANLRRVAKTTRGIRRGGSAALDLCYLAAGRFDAYWELKLSPWDTAAGVLIAREAGAVVTDFSGREFSLEMKQLVTANPRLLRKIRNLLR